MTRDFANPQCNDHPYLARDANIPVLRPGPLHAARMATFDCLRESLAVQ